VARSGEQARSALIEHAERLFAERGIEAVSLRDVSAAAGQRNHSAAQYHFGDRGGLVAAVFQARMGEVGRRRQERLDDLVANGHGADLVALVTAAIEPLVEVVAETGGWYARFLARTRWDTLATEVVVRLPEVASYRAVVRRIVSLLDGMPADIRRSRADQLLTLVVGTVAGWEWARQRGDAHLSQRRLTDDLVSTAVALLHAPLPIAHVQPPTLTGAPA
jgi:AcrR family transcriptional regulator